MHPLVLFRYCPRCGSSRFEEHNEKAKKCRDCGFVYYFNSCSATVALILNSRNELLVTRRAKEPAKGTFDLPGGFIDMYETGEEGVAREVKEETGFTVRQSTYLFSLPNIYPFSGFEVHTLDMFFLCRVEDTSAPEAYDDVAETFFIPIEKIEPQKFGDARGYFMETYRKEIFDRYVGEINFVQDNQSHSTYGVLRGLHYQKGNYSQAKLVRVLNGRVLDVAVDLRKSSPTFGKYVMVELSEENNKQLFIPRGFAHGFLVLSDTATFAYKVDNVYAPDQEATLMYDDPSVGIKWPLAAEKLLLSAKDLNGKYLADADCFE